MHAIDGHDARHINLIRRLPRDLPNQTWLTVTRRILHAPGVVVRALTLLLGGAPVAIQAARLGVCRRWHRLAVAQRLWRGSALLGSLHSS
jgi:hypothetical protein